MGYKGNISIGISGENFSLSNKVGKDNESCSFSADGTINKDNATVYYLINFSPLRLISDLNKVVY